MQYEGKSRGKADGEAIGETKSCVEIAKRMKSQGMEISIISEFTKLSIEEIDNLN